MQKIEEGLKLKAYGLNSGLQNNESQNNTVTLEGESGKSNGKRNRAICNEHHPVYKCKYFLDMPILEHIYVIK